MAYNIAEFRALLGLTKYASDPEVRLALSRIAEEAKAKLADSSASDFFELLSHSLQKLKGPANAELRVRCLLDCATYFYVVGDVLQGIDVCQDAVKLARQTQDLRALRKSETSLGILLADAGSVAQAIEVLVEAIDVALRIDDLDGYAVCLINLGVALLYAGQFEDAISCLTLAEEVVEQLPTRDQRLVDIFANKAACYLRLRRFDEGVIAAKRSVDPGLSNNHLSRFVREVNYIQLLLEQGARTAALERAEIVTSLALTTTSPRALILADISRGIVDVFYGDVSRGLNLLMDAQRRSAADNVLQHDSLIALIKAHEELGRYDEALHYLHQLLEFVRARRESFATWHVRIGSHHIRVDTPPTAELQELEGKHSTLRAKVAEALLAQCQVEMLERLAVTADLREEPSGEHGYRVGRLAAILAEELAWGSNEIATLELAARLHDVGKIAVPDRILLTSEQLKEAERHFMSTHTLIGAELLAKSNIPQLKIAEEIALHHHEWWDGTGYPKNLAGKRIPIHARIVALADVLDALTHGRPYSPPWSIDRAIEEIHGRRGTQFDPELTDRFIEVVERLRNEHPDLDEYLGRAGRNSPFLQARQKIKLMLARERDHEQKTTVAGNETRH